MLLFLFIAHLQLPCVLREATKPVVELHAILSTGEKKPFFKRFSKYLVKRITTVSKKNVQKKKTTTMVETWDNK